MEIAENLKKIVEGIPDSVKLVAVSKTKPNEDIIQAYQSGQRAFGENKVQELIGKYEQLPKDIEWHFIGHLQSNKVKYVASFIHMLHGIDSLKLLRVIEKEGKKNNRTINCLLQFHIAEESTKFGLTLKEAKEILELEEFQSFEFVKVCGVMGMATYTDNESQVRKEFHELLEIFNMLKDGYFKDNQDFKEISMGMSGDYLMAIEEGATIIRVGSVIFGERNYN